MVPSPAGTFALTYKATVAYAITYYVDALTGDIVRVVDEKDYQTGVGTGTKGEAKKMATTRIGTPVAFIVGGAVRIARQLWLGAQYAVAEMKPGASISAVIPHPLLFNAPRTVEGSTNDVAQRTQRAPGLNVRAAGWGWRSR